jgi:opacity protein-like surface antigen
MRKTLVLAFVFATAGLAQIGVGIKGGLPLTDLFDRTGNVNGASTETKRYVIGPMVDLRLPAGFGIEFDALYQKANFDSPLSATGSLLTSPFNTDSWEFPLLLKYRFGGTNAVAASARPYIAAGASFRRLSDVGNVGAFITGNRGGELERNNTGFTAGAGIEIRALFIRVAPEFRFTRWGTDHFTAGLANIWKTNRNQGQFLIGLYF